MAYQCYRNSFGRTVCRNNRFSSWGRWVLLGVILALALLAFILFACISARRRRKFGRKPFMGTGWAGGNPQVQQQPPPQYAQYGNYNNTGKPGDVENGGYYQPQQQQQYGYGNQYQQPYGQNVQAGTYQPPAQPPPVAQSGGWR